MQTIESSRDRLRSRLERLRPDTPRLWGTLSAHEMICHASDLFRVALGERPAEVHGKLFHRTAMKWFALWIPLRWPRNVRTLREADPKRSGTAPDVFEEDRKELLRLIDAFLDKQDEFPPHPLFGPLSRREWMRWAHLHTDHHLRQFGV